MKILENIYNEVYVTDNKLDVIYVNDACQRHYNLTQDEMIGKSHTDLSKENWYPSIFPLIYKEKRRMVIEQMTVIGEKIISITNPCLG